jgi:hypothetical protein
MANHRQTDPSEVGSRVPGPEAAGLPPPGAKWTPQRKARVVAAVRDHVLGFEAACELYGLTAEEFRSWHSTIDRHGVRGLSNRSLEERRRASRRATDEPGRVVLGPNRDVACSIANLSEGGARLELSAPVTLPDSFHLECTRTGRAAAVRLVWQNGKAAGVCLDTQLQIGDAPLGEWLLAGV